MILLELPLSGKVLAASVQISIKNLLLSGPRQQLNQVTSHLDASIVYGSSWNETLKLRDLLRTGGYRINNVSFHFTILLFLLISITL